MADGEGFDFRRDLPLFLASILDKTKYVCQNDEGEAAADAHAEVIDQSIRMVRSIRDCRDIIGTSDKEELDPLAGAKPFCPRVIIFKSSHRNKPVVTETPQKIVFPQEKRKRKLLEDHVLTFLLRCWKNCVNWDSVGLILQK